MLGFSFQEKPADGLADPQLYLANVPEKERDFFLDFFLTYPLFSQTEEVCKMLYHFFTIRPWDATQPMVYDDYNRARKARFILFYTQTTESCGSGPKLDPIFGAFHFRVRRRHSDEKTHCLHPSLYAH